MKKRIRILIVSLSLFIYVVIVKYVLEHDELRDGIPVLGYHMIASDEDKATIYKDNNYVISVSQFEKQMEYLASHHYQTLMMEELDAYMHHNYKVKEKSVALTFDDGDTSFHTIVKPILQKYHLHVTSFVIGEKLAKYQSGYLQSNELVNDETVAYYSHSYGLHHFVGNQKKVNTLSKSELMDDIEKSKQYVDSTYYAYPYGVYNELAESVLKENGVHLAFSYNQNRNMVIDDDSYALPRYIMFANMPMFYSRQTHQFDVTIKKASIHRV